MYYETLEGDQELQRMYKTKRSERFKTKRDLADEWEIGTEETEETTAVKRRKTRRSEASMLEETFQTDHSTPSRPKRTKATSHHSPNDNQIRIDQFYSKKLSPNKRNQAVTDYSILPPVAITDHERCPICETLIPNDTLEVHTNTCMALKSDAAKELLSKTKERRITESKIKDALFKRTTRKTVANQLCNKQDETTTCSSCGMQMTLFRLENQHKKQCLKISK